MQFHWLSKKDAKKLVERLRAAGIAVSGERAAFMAEDEVRLYEVGGSIIIESESGYIPVVDESVNGEVLRRMPSVTVDMGAVEHVINGADVMRPGIVSFDSRFNKSEIVVVRDIKNRRALAICRALMSSEEAEALSRGKILENIHYVGDKYWQLSRKLIELTR
jgi:PUA domain protein